MSQWGFLYQIWGALDVGQILMRGSLPSKHYQHIPIWNSLIQPLAPSTAPRSHCQIRCTSPPTTLLLQVQVVDRGYLLHWWHLAASRVPPFLCCIPLSWSADQIPMRRGRPPLASVAAPPSHPWFLGPVIQRNALGHSLPLTDIRGRSLSSSSCNRDNPRGLSSSSSSDPANSSPSAPCQRVSGGSVGNKSD